MGVRIGMESLSGTRWNTHSVYGIVVIKVVSPKGVKKSAG